MARTLDAILSEINQRSDPSRQTVLSQLADLPRQQEAEEAGLRAQLDVANEGILADARRRGLGFSGIPVGEQAKFAATDFAPALARVRTAGLQRKTSLEEALAGLNRENYAQANNIYSQERSFAEQQRQFDQQMQFEREKYAAAQALAQQQARGAGAGGSGIPQQPPTLPPTPPAPQQPPQPVAPPQDEQDAAYLGRLRSLPQDEQVQIIAGLRYGTSERAKRLFQLGKQLGYWRA